MPDAAYLVLEDPRARVSLQRQLSCTRSRLDAIMAVAGVAAVQIELQSNVGAMMLNGPYADKQFARNLPAGLPLGHQRQDGALLIWCLFVREASLEGSEVLVRLVQTKARQRLALG